MRLLSALLMGSLMVSGLAACNTFEGMGKDIEAGGGAISKGAVNAKEKMNESEYNNTTQHNYPDQSTQY